MNPCETVAFVTAIACTLSKHCSTEELSILSPIFTQLGDTLNTILAVEETCNNNDNNINNNNNDINNDDS